MDEIVTANSSHWEDDIGVGEQTRTFSEEKLQAEETNTKAWVDLGLERPKISTEANAAGEQQVRGSGIGRA